VTWLDWSEAPDEVVAAAPRVPLRLGSHVGRTFSLDGDRWVVVFYDWSGAPLSFMIIPSPPKPRS
jgi:hypothetical protein